MLLTFLYGIGRRREMGSNGQFSCSLTDRCPSSRLPVRNSSKATPSGSVDSRILAVRDRFSIIKQAVLRNENFSPRPFGAANREKTLKVRFSYHYFESTIDMNYGSCRQQKIF